MNFIDSLKAVLAGRPNEADAEQRPVAEDVIAIIREHDESIHHYKQQIADAREAERIIVRNRACLEGSVNAISLERARCVAITETCVKANISVQKTIQFIQSGVDPEEVASFAARVMQQPVATGIVQETGDDRLRAAVEAMKSASAE